MRQLCPQRRWMSYVLASWVQNIDVCTWDASSLTSCLGFVVISSWLQQDARSRCLSKGCNIPMLGEGMQYPLFKFRLSRSFRHWQHIAFNFPDFFPRNKECAKPRAACPNKNQKKEGGNDGQFSNPEFCALRNF